MIRYLIFVWVPLLLLLVAPAGQVILSVYVLKGKTRLNLFWVDFIALIAGFLLPVCATMLSIAGLAPGVRCVTGNVGIAILGWMLTALLVPVIGVAFFIISWHLKKRKEVAG